MKRIATVSFQECSVPLLSVPYFHSVTLRREGEDLNLMSL